MKQGSLEINWMVKQAKDALLDSAFAQKKIDEKTWKESGYTKTELIEKVKYHQGIYQGLVLAMSHLLGYNTADINLMVKNYGVFND